MTRVEREKVLGVLQAHREQIKQYGVSKIGIFGSVAKNTSNRRSDIDVLVHFKKKTFDNYFDLKFFLERLLKRKVDLVIDDTIKPTLRYVRKEALYVKGS